MSVTKISTCPTTNFKWPELILTTDFPTASGHRCIILHSVKKRFFWQPANKPLQVYSLVLQASVRKYRPIHRLVRVSTNRETYTLPHHNTPPAPTFPTRYLRLLVAPGIVTTGHIHLVPFIFHMRTFAFAASAQHKRCIICQ